MGTAPAGTEEIANPAGVAAEEGALSLTAGASPGDTAESVSEATGFAETDAEDEGKDPAGEAVFFGEQAVQSNNANTGIKSKSRRTLLTLL